MWCSTCRADVSVRTTGHAGGLLCSRCGHDLLAAAKPTDAIRQAREILERWNSSDLFERITRTESLDTLPRRFGGILKPGSLQQALSSDPHEAASPQDVSDDPNVAGELATKTLAESELTVSSIVPAHPQLLIDEAAVGLSRVRPQRPCAVGEDDGELDHEPCPDTHFSSAVAEGDSTGKMEGDLGNNGSSSPSCSPSGRAGCEHSVEPTAVDLEISSDIGANESRISLGDCERIAVWQVCNLPDFRENGRLQTCPTINSQPLAAGTSLPEAQVHADAEQSLEESAASEFPESQNSETSVEESEEYQPDVVEVPHAESPDTEGPADDADAVVPDGAPGTELILYEAGDVGIIETRPDPADGDQEQTLAPTLETTADESSGTTERETSDDVPEMTGNAIAPVFDFSQFSHIGVIGMTTVANVRKIREHIPPKPSLAEVTQPLLPARVAIVVNEDESEPEPSKPAETANVSELLIAPVPKKIQRSPMRRPLLHRRFQMERPATTSPTGSDIVNRNLRVDQPGGSKDAPEAAQQNAAITSSVAPETKIVSNSPAPGKRFRIDGPESVDTVTGTDGRRARTQTLPKHRYIDDAHDSAPRGPHFEVSAPRRSNLTSATGQFLAYLGVLGLTVGTAMVIYGHFGGYSEYTPTGWLVTTVAQMLLFLGVINLVSGGIEQNNEDVSRRINTLGEQLIRIEAVTSEVLKGPKISAHRYANPDAEVEESTRETADVDRR